MNEFVKEFGLMTLECFFDQTNQLSKKNTFHKSFPVFYKGIDSIDNKLYIYIFLKPKNEDYPNYPVLMLKIYNSEKEKHNGNLFQDISQAFLESEHTLKEVLLFMKKYLMGCISISSYLNFYNTHFLQLETIKRKYYLDYLIEPEYNYSNQAEIKKLFSSNDGYEFSKTIESLSQSIELKVVVYENCSSINSMIHLQAKLAKSGFKNKRDRFYSEDVNNQFSGIGGSKTDIKLNEFNFDMKTIEDPSAINITRSRQPFYLVEDNLLEDFKEESKDGGSMSVVTKRTRKNTQDLIFCSTTMTDTNNSISCKLAGEVSKKVGCKLEKFNDTPSVDNLYYMANLLRKYLQEQIVKSKDYSANGATNFDSPSIASNKDKKSSNDFNVKIIDFNF